MTTHMRGLSTTPSPSFPRRGVARWRLSQIICSIIELAKLELVEINLEKQSDYKVLFQQNLDVKRIVPQMAAMHGTPIIARQTLLFIDEIQDCQEAIMALRYFKEYMPELHVVAAGSLLEFVLDDIPTFGVGRIHSMYMYPMTFDEFLLHFNLFCESTLVGKQQPPHRLRLQTDGEARLHNYHSSSQSMPLCWRARAGPLPPPP